MSYPAIIEYLSALAKIYFCANKEQKTQHLDHACLITNRHRKSLIRTLNTFNPIENKKKNCGAKVKYPQELLLPHIKYLWIAMEKISAKRMKAAFDDWLPLYRENGVDGHVKYLLQKMSVSTLDRFLKILRKSSVHNQKGLSSTSPARHMKNKVPINTLDSRVTKPGFTQADTVAHCGDRLEGTFINSITITDLASTWTENRSLFTKKGLEVKAVLDNIEKALPFQLLAINTDSGSEFLNLPVFNMYRRKRITFTRSRPYKKNDNCYVEQKNYTHVRELFGYQRLDQKELTDLMNDIYINYWNPLQNFFLPSFKLREKQRIGAKIKKIYGPPLTPYRRLMNSDALTNEQKQKLHLKKSSLNPFDLKRGLEEKLSDFFKLVNEYNKTKEQSK